MNTRALTIAAFIAAAAAVPFALAQSQPEPAPWSPPKATEEELAPDNATPEEGADLIERGAGILFRDLMERVAPELDQMTRDMSDAMELLGPAVSDMAVLVDDMKNYEAPERLENGDIIIRRKAEAPPPPPVGEGLRRFSEPGDAEPGAPRESVPVDPYLPQTEL